MKIEINKYQAQLMLNIIEHAAKIILKDKKSPAIDKDAALINIRMIHDKITEQE